MPDLRKRPPAGTLQRRVFLLLRDHASMSPLRIADRIGCSVDSARKACRYLELRGLLVKHRIAYRITLYHAIPGKHVPDDRRGKPPACRNHRGRVAYGTWLRMMHKKHGAAWRPPVLDPTPLAQVWRMQ